MSLPTHELEAPHILVVDDEKQIHSSLRLRLGSNYQVTSQYSARDALALVRRQAFDLCIVDIHMPDMDGLEFIEVAREIDPALGYVVLSGFDSEENLRRAIPLQVLDFLAKPLPERAGFEKHIPDWVFRVRNRRNELAIARNSASIIQDLELARIERDVESTASESAREALLQTASLLTTIQALLLSANHSLEPLLKTDLRWSAVFRSLQEARRHADQAGTIADGYFGSAYADRESSPAIIDACLQHAIGIALRLAKADERKQAIDLHVLGRHIAASELTGIDFLLMVIPALVQMLAVAETGTTLHVSCDELSRLELAVDNPRLRSFVWVNRRNARLSSSAVLITIRSSAPAFEDSNLRAWLRGNVTPLLHIPSRGLLHGIQKAGGLLGVGVRPETTRCEVVLVLPI